MSTLLSINNYYYYRGGAETVFLEHNRMLEAQGWKVVPFSMKHPKNLDTPWSEYFVEEIEFGESYSFSQKLARMAKVIYSFEAKHKIERILDVVRPDVCHAHNIYHHISPSVLETLKRHGIPTVLTLHDLKIACPAYNMLAADGICERCKGGRLYNVVVHRCIKQSAALSAVVMMESVLHRVLGSYRDNVDRFVVPSRFYIDKFSEWGFPRSLFRHVPNFVDVDRYVPEFLPGTTFVYFGRVSREKGLTTLIRAAAVANCKVSIVGTGPQLDELRSLVAELNAQVTFLGYLTGGILHEVVRSARAVVLPSEWYENAPMTILEAYALGKPVIGARIGGIPELIKEGETGLGFESGDVASLAAALRSMAGYADAHVELLGRTGWAWAGAEFTARMYQDRILETYRGVGVGNRDSLPASVLV